MSQQIGQPSRVVDVGLAARDVLHVCGIGEHQRERAVGQNVPTGFQYTSRCLHRDIGATVRRGPLRQADKARCRRVECLHLGDDFATGCDAYAGDHALFVDIETRTPRIKDFNLILLCGVGVGSTLFEVYKACSMAVSDHWHNLGCSLISVHNFLSGIERPTSVPTPSAGGGAFLAGNFFLVLHRALPDLQA